MYLKILGQGTAYREHTMWSAMMQIVMIKMRKNIDEEGDTEDDENDNDSNNDGDDDGGDDKEEKEKEEAGFVTTVMTMVARITGDGDVVVVVLLMSSKRWAQYKVVKTESLGLELLLCVSVWCAYLS